MPVYLLIFGYFTCVIASSEFNFGLGKHHGLALVTHIQTSSNNNLEIGMPRNIDLQLDLLTDKEGPFSLHLVRNIEGLEFKPVYVIRENSDGLPSLVKEDISIEQNIGLYQCDDTLASFTVACEGLEFGICKPLVLGSINLNGKEFDMKPGIETRTSPLSKHSLYNVYNRKTPDKEGKTCMTGENQEIAAISTAFQKREKEIDFEGYAMRNTFRFAHAGSPRFHQRPTFRHRPSGPSGSSNTYAVGLLILVDDIIYKRFYGLSKGYTHFEKDVDAKTLIRQYYAHTVNAMDIRYKNIKHPVYDIRIVVSGYLIDDNHMIDIWSDPSEAEVEDVMLRAIRWRKTMMSELPPHDHLMIFTGRDLYTKFSNDYSVTGFASLDSVCRQDSVSIIEDKGGFDCIITATHELGHSLGARHDGDRNICTPHDKYIMTSIGGDVTLHTRLNPFRFSECSKSYFLDRLQTLSNQGYNCLSIRKSYYDPREFAKLTSVSTGQVYNANTQCQMKLGEKSYYGWGGNLGSFKDICTHMACKSNKTATSYNLYNAARGTSCGNKKWCIDGECAYDQVAPSKEEKCVHGDSLRSFAAYYSCAHLVASDPSKCMDSYYRQFCCESCKQYGLKTFSLSGFNPGRSKAKIMSIPVTQHMQRVLPNTFSARRMPTGVQATGFSRQAPTRGMHPVFSASQVNNNFNHASRISRNPTNAHNELRVFAMPNARGSHSHGSFNTQQPNRFHHGHHNQHQTPMHGIPHSGVRADVTNNGGNSITLPDHQRLNPLQSPTMSADTLDLTSFRNLILRTLQLLARTNNYDYSVTPNNYNSYDRSSNDQYGTNRQFYNMRDIPRTVVEQQPQNLSSTSAPTNSSIALTLLQSRLDGALHDLNMSIPAHSSKNRNILSEQLSKFTEMLQKPKQAKLGVFENSFLGNDIPVIASGLK